MKDDSKDLNEIPSLDLHCECTITLEEAAFGKDISVKVPRLETCTECGGTGKIIENPCNHCNGSGKVSIEKVISLHIPKGIDTGNRLRVQNGGENCDLYVNINVKPHPIFRRDGVDIYCELTITPEQAKFGAKVDVPTIDGKATLKIPKGTQSGTVLKINEKGMPRLRGNGRGDEFVSIKVLTPENLSEYQYFDNNSEQHSLLDKLKGIFS